MNERITVKDLRAVCDRINRTFGQALLPWTFGQGPAGGKANIGTFYIDGAYGGWELMRIMNEGGGVTEPLGSTGHVPARELYGLMHAYLRGVEAGVELQAEVTS